MPTYQYACTECGHQLEAVQSFSDAALTECPDCRGRLRKVFNSVGIVFKGSGFYRNDSRPGYVNPGKSTDNGGDSAAKPAASGDSSSSPSSSTPSSTPASSGTSTSSGATAAA